MEIERDEYYRALRDLILVSVRLSESLLDDVRVRSLMSTLDSINALLRGSSELELVLRDTFDYLVRMIVAYRQVLSLFDSVVSFCYARGELVRFSESDLDSFRVLYEQVNESLRITNRMDYLLGALRVVHDREVAANDRDETENGRPIEEYVSDVLCDVPDRMNVDGEYLVDLERLTAESLDEYFDGFEISFEFPDDGDDDGEDEDGEGGGIGVSAG